MAPRRGGGGGSYGGSSGPVCPGFLQGSAENLVAYYASYILFLLLTFGIIIYSCCVRKRSDKLIRLLLVVLAFMSVGWAVLLLGTTLSLCLVFDNFYDWYNFVITYTVFFNIAQWLLLFIQVWGVNRMLVKRLGSGQAVVKIVTLAITGVMAALAAGLTGLGCYNRWQLTSSVSYSRYSRLHTRDDERKLGAAYWILYLLSVLAGSAISVALLLRMRSKSIAVNDVLKRTVALAICMLLWVIFQLVPVIINLQDLYLSSNMDITLSYLAGFFQIFTFLAIVSLCKLSFWKESEVQTAYNSTTYGQPEYAPMHPPQQQNYYQQQPVYSSVPAPVKGNGHMVQVQ